MYHKDKNISLGRILFLTVSMLWLCAPQLKAFSTSTYATNSVLSEGKWVKISVPKSGVYIITPADLSKWGFSDISKVKVYGYGGERLPDILSKSTFIDDLPVVQSETTSRGIVFYAQGPESWNSPEAGKYVQSLNPFTTVGYYYLSDRDSTSSNTISTSALIFDTSLADEAQTTFTDAVFHETDLVNIGETGHFMLGENFKYTPSQTFSFSMPDIVNDQDVWLECQFAAKTLSAASNLKFTANGTALPTLTTDRIASCSTSAYIHGKITTTRKSFNVSGDELTIGIKHSSSATISMAHLDYITLNYTRLLKLHNGSLNFRSSQTRMSLTGASQATRVWDVTNPRKITAQNTTLAGDKIYWQNEYTGLRNYVAWNEDATLPSPSFVGTVANQNLHNLSTPDMVIFTVGEWSAQAERIADLHRNSSDSLSVLVINQDDVFNEFSSGSPDANSFRKMLKMMWDRGDANGTPLRYALFLGGVTHDNRHLSDEVKNSGVTTMPLWQTDKGLDDNESYCSDDIFAFLKDNSGSNMGTDHYCIAVGRMPVKSTSEAKNMVDKLYKYVNNSPETSWKNQVMILADDMDNGIHMEQAESMWNLMKATPSGSDFFYNKLYIDAYTREGSSYPSARTQMFKLLDEGVLWWTFIGHANTTSWTGDGILTYNDMVNMYLKKYPILYAATCDFLRWDGNARSGAEVLYLNTDGGIIACIASTRPVYIANNGMLSNALAPIVFKRNNDGNFFTIGEIYQQAKNNLYDSKGNKVSDRNKLRFVLMGDPAMRFAAPSAQVNVETINGLYVEAGEQPTIQARQMAVVDGYITDYSGNVLTDFNGTITTTLYDAEKSTTSHGYSSTKDDGKEVTFEEQGSMLYTGRDSVRNGRFSIKIAMPTEIANNFRPAALSFYAEAENGAEAIGLNNNFYVYGIDESIPDDTIPPVINYLYINHDQFANGDIVNESPMIIASVSDNIGINLSSAGVGHQMSLRVDGAKSYTDVSQYFTPSIGEEASGTINYPIENLADGHHTLLFKVWDTAGNSAQQEIEITVENGLAPRVFDVYTDANPAYTNVNFYIKHDRPDAMSTVEVQVFDLMGRLVWSSSKTGQSDMSISSPLNWNLCDMAGRRVNRGIYVYKALITTDGTQYSSGARKLAVAAQ